MSTPESSNNEGAKAVLDFLKSNVPKSDIPNIESEMNRDFVLAKRRSKQHKKKGSKSLIRALSKNERKVLGFYNIPRKGINFNDMLPLYQIWSEYMSELLDFENVPEFPSKQWEVFTQTVFKADFHGSILKVIRSKCPSYVGKTGICIMDTRNTFKIVSKDNIITTLPKKQCVFEIFVKTHKLTIFGKLLCVRAAERSTKKVRSPLFPDL